MKTLRLSIAMGVFGIASCATGPGRFADIPLSCPVTAIEYCETHTATHIKSRRYCRCVSRDNAYATLGMGPGG